MLSYDQNKQFDEILEELSNNLDITKSQYEAAVKSYQHVGKWLSRPESPLAAYDPEILPQGSFLLGTMIRPLEGDELDVDLVCRLTGKRLAWTQYDVKKIVGDCLKENETYKRMLDKEGRRCWTLLYREDASFHMDILPSIVSQGYRLLLEKSFSATDLQNVQALAIRITDKELPNYFTATDLAEWLRSNPFGYAAWFKERSNISQTRLLSLNEAIQPLPPNTAQKLPLQIIVQLLKRHRDIMFNGKDDKPISIIITTLAAKAYNRQTSIIDGLLHVVNNIDKYIEERRDANGKVIKWISNPVNPEENFADKWPANPQKQKNFYDWLSKLKADISGLMTKRGYDIQFSMSEVFGQREVNKTFSNIGDAKLKFRESGAMKMAAGSGLLGNVGRATVAQHSNFGGVEK